MSRSEHGLRIAVIAVAAALLLVAVPLAFRAGRAGTSPSATPGALASSMKPIDGIHCDLQEHTDFHRHAHLAVVNKGKELVIPAQIGIPSGGCLYWLHTHDESGVIHIEAPRSMHPVLGDFFDIWGQPLSRDRIANVAVSSPASLRIYVNGKPYPDNPRTIPLRDHTVIAIEVGAPFVPPKPYDFSGV